MFTRQRTPRDLTLCSHSTNLIIWAKKFSPTDLNWLYSALTGHCLDDHVRFKLDTRDLKAQTLPLAHCLLLFLHFLHYSFASDSPAIQSLFATMQRVSTQVWYSLRVRINRTQLSNYRPIITSHDLSSQRFYVPAVHVDTALFKK